MTRWLRDRRKITAWSQLSCLFASLTCSGRARAQSAPLTWHWNLVSSHVPDFEEKGKENQQMLVVEVLFQNLSSGEQRLTVAQTGFRASTDKGKPIEVLGLLFRIMGMEGAKSMVYTGGIKRMETLNEGDGGASTVFVHSPGPVEVVVGGGQSYYQRLLVRRPRGKKPFRLQFGHLPELDVTVPK